MTNPTRGQSLGGGDYSYTIPYTGVYEITLSGSQGGNYSNNAGGYGYTVTKKIRLQKGTTLSGTVGTHPGGCTGALTVPRGNASTLSISGVGNLTAGAGGGYVTNNIAPNDVYRVTWIDGNGSSRYIDPHWHSGDGKSGANHSNQFPVLETYDNPGGCYVGYHECDNRCYRTCGGTPYWTGHGHNYADGCTWHDYANHSARQWSCRACGKAEDDYVVGRYQWDNHGGHCPDLPTTCTRIVYRCTGLPNRWKLGCGYQQGEIRGFTAEQSPTGNCSYDAAMTPDSASISKTGDGQLIVKLVETEQLYYLNTTVKYPSYLNSKCNLIIKDDTVVYFKRD